MKRMEAEMVQDLIDLAAACRKAGGDCDAIKVCVGDMCRVLSHLPDVSHS